MGHRGFNNYFFPYELAMKLFLAGLNTLNNEKKDVNHETLLGK